MLKLAMRPKAVQFPVFFCVYEIRFRVVFITSKVDFRFAVVNATFLV